MAEDLQNFIGGQWTDLSFDKRSELINPSTGEVFATAPVSGETEVDAAVSSAAAAFEGWRDATPAERSLALLKIADAIEARAGEFVKAESQNTGKPLALTESEVGPPACDFSPSLASNSSVTIKSSPPEREALIQIAKCGSAFRWSVRRKRDVTI